MCKVLRFNSIDYPILNNPRIRSKSSDVVITSVTIDFTGYLIADLPFKYQEVLIVNNPGVGETIEFIGYVEKHVLPTFETGFESLLLTLNIMPPRVLASKRVVKKKYNLEPLSDLCLDALSGLIADGFTVEFNDLSTEVLVTRTFIDQSVEKMLNNLAKEFDFIWYIDEFKKIYLRDSVNIFNSAPLVEWRPNSLEYVKSMKPEIRSNDYANVISIKNASRVTRLTCLDVKPTVVGQRFVLDFPIWLEPQAVQKYYGDNNDRTGIVSLQFETLPIPTAYNVNYVSGAFVYTTGLANYNDDPTADVCLIFDANEPTLVVAIQVNVVFTPNSFVVVTPLALKVTPYRFFDTTQIEQVSDYANTTGIIEKTISLNNKRYSEDELFQIAKGNILQANNEVGLVNVVLENEINESYLAFLENVKLFTRIIINMPNILTVGDFVVTKIEKTENQKVLRVLLTLENKNFNETFLDIYRKEDFIEDERQLTGDLVSILVKEEDFVEKAEIFVNGVNVNEIS